MEPTPKPEPQPATAPVEPEPVVPPTVSKTAMTTGKVIVFTSNAVAITGIILTIVLAVGTATWNLRGFITSEIEDATAATNARLESRLNAAIADIRQEIRAGRDSADRQMAEIRQFIFDLYGQDDENGDDASDEDHEDTRD